MRKIPKKEKDRVERSRQTENFKNAANQISHDDTKVQRIPKTANTEYKGRLSYPPRAHDCYQRVTPIDRIMYVPHIVSRGLCQEHPVSVNNRSHAVTIYSIANTAKVQ